MFDPSKRPSKAYWNYHLVNAQKRLGRKKVFGRPYFLSLDTTNFCNLRCPFCPTGTERSGGRTHRIMGIDVFRKVFSPLEDYLFSVDLYNWGEPLLNPEIYEIIRHVSEKGIYTRLSSNLNAFKKNHAERIVNSGLDLLVVSLDGMSRKTYGKYRVGGSFEKVVDNMKHLIDTKRSLRREHPKILWQFLVFKHNEHELEAAREMATRIGVDMFVPGSPYVPPEYRREWVSNHYRQGESVTEERCAWPWTAIALDPEGNVSPCCYRKVFRKYIGNTLSKDFSNVWNGEEYQKIRGHIKNGDVGSLCDDCEMNGKIPIHLPMKEQIERETWKRFARI